jgi:hypothetical protein
MFPRRDACIRPRPNRWNPDAAAGLLLPGAPPSGFIEPIGWRCFILHTRQKTGVEWCYGDGNPKFDRRLPGLRA